MHTNHFLTLIALLLTASSLSHAASKQITLTCTSACVRDDWELSCDLPDNTEVSEVTEVKYLSINSIDIEFENKSTSLQILQRHMTETMPQKIGLHAQAIKRLAITSTPLKLIKRDDFIGMGHLRQLNLESNRIEAMPPDVFHDLHSLEVLSLNDNQIAKLPASTLAPLLHLREFNCEYNKIERLETSTFKNNSNLQRINLNDNNLVTVRENFLNKPHLEVVDLRRNSEYCRNCEIVDNAKRTEKLRECYYDRFNGETAAKVLLEVCVEAKTSERDDLAAIYRPCKVIKDSGNATLTKKYENCTAKAVSQGVSFDSIKTIENCIVELRRDETLLRGNYEACVKDKTTKSTELRTFLGNCFESVAENRTRVNELFNSCFFCDQMNKQENVKRCAVRFVKDHGDNIGDFQANVDKYFKL